MPSSTHVSCLISFSSFSCQPGQSDDDNINVFREWIYSSWGFALRFESKTISPGSHCSTNRFRGENLQHRYFYIIRVKLLLIVNRNSASFRTLICRHHNRMVSTILSTSICILIFIILFLCSWLRAKDISKGTDRPNTFVFGHNKNSVKVL